MDGNLGALVMVQFLVYLVDVLEKAALVFLCSECNSKSSCVNGRVVSIFL